MKTGSKRAAEKNLGPRSPCFSRFLVARFVQQTGGHNPGSAVSRILASMATKLSDHSIDDLKAMLLATEASAGPDSVSARIIRRELQRKLREAESRGRPATAGGAQ